MTQEDIPGKSMLDRCLYRIGIKYPFGLILESAVIYIWLSGLSGDRHLKWVVWMHRHALQHPTGAETASLIYASIPNFLFSQHTHRGASSPSEGSS